MKKCLLCTICSWIVGLSTLWLVGMGLGGWALPSGGLVNIGYALLGLIALGFLYYQVVPCSRCVARNQSNAASASSEMEMESEAKE